MKKYSLAILSFGFFVSMCLTCLGAIAAENQFSSLEKLDLNTEQKNKITQIQTDYNLKINKLEGSVQRTQGQLDSLLSVDSYTSAQINDLKRQIKELQSQISDLKVKGWVEAKGVLTKEQEEQLRKIQLKKEF